MTFIIEITPDMKATFVAETTENLDRFEEALLVLENEPENRETLNAAFRAVHGIKGNSDYIGIKDMNSLANALESFMDDLRREQIRIGPDTIPVLIEGLDILRDMNRRVTHKDYRETDISGLLKRLEQCKSGPERQAAAPPKPVREKVDVAAVFIKTARQHMEYLTQLAREILDGESEGQPSESQVPEDRVPETRDRESQARGKILRILNTFSNSARYSGFEDVLGKLKALLEQFREKESFGKSEASRLLEIIQETAALIENRDSPSPAPDSDRPESEKPDSDRPDSEKPENISENLFTELMDREIRISPEKVDSLLNLVSELTIAGNSLNYELGRIPAGTLSKPQGKDLKKSLTAYNRSFKKIQTAAMRLRLVPIDSLFERLPRIVRDLAARFDKKIEISMSGGKLEIDRKVVGQLVDPMIHLIRNAADHGIERPETRQKMHKPETGTITVKAVQEGQSALIEVTDDGRGFDLEMLRTAAVKKGFADQKAMDNASDADVIDMAFSPGFTTVSGPVDVSGRGVGMDLVRNNLRAMGGSAAVISEKDRFTTVTLTVPVSMVVAEVLLVEVSGEIYAIPLACVAETLKIAPVEIQLLNGIETVGYKDMVLTVTHLGEILGVMGRAQADTPASRFLSQSSLSALLVTSEGLLRVLLVDRIIGPDGLVVRPLEKKLAQISPFSGAAIMPDGNIVLVIDRKNLI